MRKRKHNIHNFILWTITVIAGIAMFASMFAFAFCESSWVHVLVYIVSCAWCWIFAEVNSKERK